MIVHSPEFHLLGHRPIIRGEGECFRAADAAVFDGELQIRWLQGNGDIIQGLGCEDDTKEAIASSRYSAGDQTDQNA